MLEYRRKSRKFLILCLTTFLLMFFTGCNNTTVKQTANPSTAVDAPMENTVMLQGVVVQNDTQKRTVLVQELGSDLQTTLTYNGSTVVTDRFETQIYGEDVEAGQIMEIHYDPATARIASMQVPEDAWEYQEVTKYALNNEEKSIEVAGKKFKYSNLTYVGSSGQSIELMELNKQDVITVRGTGYTVYSIVRTQGHGYIRLKNYSDFIGGMIEVGTGIILPVTENMLITAREGTYRVILCKGALSAIKTVTVQLDKETKLDFSEYQQPAKNVGMITFKIDPKGADLTINGTKVDYSDPIPLNYGTYQVTVSMTGYTEYTGTLDVEEASSTIRINLIDEKAEVATASPDAEEENTSGDSGTTTKQMDSEHTITVSAPEGAEVYLDNVYKGLAPCSFTKIIGSQTITLSKDGYITKSYSVDILDDGEDVSFSFAELVANSTPATATPTEEAQATEAAEAAATTESQ